MHSLFDERLQSGQCLVPLFGDTIKVVPDLLHRSGIELEEAPQSDLRPGDYGYAGTGDDAIHGEEELWERALTGTTAAVISNRPS